MANISSSTNNAASNNNYNSNANKNIKRSYSPLFISVRPFD